jgi:hypothetical protein
VLCDFRTLLGMDTGGIVEALRRHKVPHERIAAALGRDRTAATKMMTGRRTIKAIEVDPLLALVREYGGETIANTPDLPDADRLRDYVAVEVLPTYAGMGGGGTGDADRATSLLPRTLVEQDLRATADDLLIIDCRGDSMVPTFLDGDQVVINRRMVNLAQPGPFALWDGDGYVIKNVQRERDEGRVRIKVFSENPKYGAAYYTEDDDTLQIMGRPVWFARRVSYSR